MPSLRGDEREEIGKIGVFDETDQPHWLVLRNCSGEGVSTAVVRRTQVFRVDGVTVTPLMATPPPASG